MRVDCESRGSWERVEISRATDVRLETDRGYREQEHHHRMPAGEQPVRPLQSLRYHGGGHLLHTGDRQPAGEYARGPARSRRGERFRDDVDPAVLDPHPSAVGLTFVATAGTGSPIASGSATRRAARPSSTNPGATSTNTAADTPIAARSPKARATSPIATSPSAPPKVMDAERTEMTVARSPEATCSFVHAALTGSITPKAVSCSRSPASAGDRLAAPASNPTIAPRHSMAAKSTDSRAKRRTTGGTRALPVSDASARSATIHPITRSCPPASSA